MPINYEKFQKYNNVRYLPKKIRETIKYYTDFVSIVYLTQEKFLKYAMRYDLKLQSSMRQGEKSKASSGKHRRRH